MELLDWEKTRADHPKWRALLDFNTPKTPLTVRALSPGTTARPATPRMSIRSAPGTLGIDVATAGRHTLELFDLRGVVLARVGAAGNAAHAFAPGASGMTVLRLDGAGGRQTSAVVTYR
ncbi:MAG: hypothetical protein GF331_22555 [Chitinivibrionales bacterium]|nr:hypothetical protein [Chitinivibrionales bacterium]